MNIRSWTTAKTSTISLIPSAHTVSAKTCRSKEEGRIAIDRVPVDRSSVSSELMTGTEFSCSACICMDTCLQVAIALLSGIFSWIRKIAKSDCQLRRVCLSVCLSIRPSVFMQHLGFHWMDFHEIRYLGIFRKYVGKIQVLLKSDKNNRYFT